MPLLEVTDLSVSVDTEAGELPVLDGVSLTVDAGETLCLVGESGSGKSVTAMSIPRLNPEPQFRYTSGRILFDGVDLLSATGSELRRIRGSQVTVVFQDPTTSLNPSHRIGDQITEVLRVHSTVSRKAAEARAREVLTDVGIPHAEKAMRRYPHEFSGGMRQRALIAMALACEPRLVVADEPTTALDVTTQARILAKLHELKEKYDLALLFVTHDLGVVAQIADRVCVMYAGSIVESGTADEVFYDPLMPYTHALLASRPATTAARGDLTPIPGAPPRIGGWPPGCRFAPRCPLVEPACEDRLPRMRQEGEHSWRCVLNAGEVRQARPGHRPHSAEVTA